MMDDYISRQSAIDALWKALFEYEDKTEKQFIETDELDVEDWVQHRVFVQNMNDIDRQTILDLPSAQQWIPVSERLPDELAEVNITWINTDPPSYYKFVKSKPMTGSAVYYKERWYWYSAVCADYLKEYGYSPNDRMDDAIKVLAWMPLPEPYEGEA